MQCLKCGKMLNYSKSICLECYTTIKNLSEINLLFPMTDIIKKDFEQIITYPKYGDMKYVKDKLILIDREDKNDRMNALYTGILKNNIPYGVGIYLFEDGVRYLGEYSPENMLVTGMTISHTGYEKGLFEKFNKKSDYIETKNTNGGNTNRDNLDDIVSSSKRVSIEECKKIYINGKTLLENGNKVKGIKYIKFAAHHGNYDAALLLADCYEKGNGVSKDSRAAQGYYMQAKIFKR